MPIELLFVLTAVGLFFLGRGGVKLPQLRRSPAVGDVEKPAGADTAPVPKKPGYLSKVRGSMNPVTFFGILVFTAILIIFMLIPGDLVAYAGTILMWALTALILTSIVMLVTGWGSRLVWLTLLVGSIWLAYNPPATTAQRIAQGAETLTEKGLKGVTPSVTPLVPDFLYTSPEEKAAARKAEADELKHQQELARIAAEGEAEARVAAQAAEARTLDEMRIPATFGPCLRINTDKLNCTTVTFGPGPDTFYDRQAPARHCILPDVKPARNSDDPTVFREINLGGGQKRYLGPSGLTVQFFDLKEGESYKGGKPCVIPK